MTVSMSIKGGSVNKHAEIYLETDSDGDIFIVINGVKIAYFSRDGELCFLCNQWVQEELLACGFQIENGHIKIEE